MNKSVLLSILGLILIFTAPQVFNYFQFPVLLLIIYPVIFYFIFKSIYKQNK